jgi:hypothetical protein
MELANEGCSASSGVLRLPEGRGPRAGRGRPAAQGDGGSLADGDGSATDRPERGTRRPAETIERDIRCVRGRPSMSSPSRLRRASRALHKYLGLALLLYAVLMGLTGILVNHPDWLRELSVPGWLVPAQYHVEDFDRGALARACWSERDPARGFVAGTEGVWTTADGGRSFDAHDEALPRSPWRRLTHDLMLVEDLGPPRLLAACESGLWTCDPLRADWRRVPLGAGTEDADHAVPATAVDEPVRALLRVGDDLVAVTGSGFFRGPLAADRLTLAAVSSSRALPETGPARDVSLVWLLFDLHSGEVFGLLGRLLVDAVGLVIVFLGLSAFWLWYFPGRLRRHPGERAGAAARGLFRWMFRNHLRLGIWVGASLVLLSATGFLMRPPLLILPASLSLDVERYPGQAPGSSWHERIHRAVHEPDTATILVETSEGFWRGADDLSAPFEPTGLDLPIHVMGSNVLALDAERGLVVGSFSGAFHADRAAGEVLDALTDAPAGEVSRYRSAETMVTGYFRAANGDRFVSTWHDGVQALDGVDRAGRFAQPEALAERFRMPLWNYAFELHNGRFFRDWIGGLYFLLPIVGSLLFLLLSLTGIYDWFAIRRSRRG